MHGHTKADLIIIFISNTLSNDNLRSGVPFVLVGSGKERLIQLLDYSSVASPQSGLFSDWSRNKRVLRTKP